ncbi:ATP-grasp domain-containing protein [Prosthecobacter sp.]|uniref:ATP-grasp domain-containing protein n=1 Tax=Prosthecobacter sp. TaxID=1965333 RepID=UPI0037831818
MNSRTAYVLSDAEGKAYSANGAVAAQGFKHLGYTVRYFTREELPQLDILWDTPVVAGVGTVVKALKQLGIEPPAHQTLPAVLTPFLGRRCWRSTIGDIRREGVFPIFLKPFEDTKRFTGFVAQREADIDAIPTHEGDEPLTPDYVVLAQEPVNFRSEWRTFVLRGRVVGTALHTGDPLLFPNAQIIRQTVAAYEPPLAGYSADFGVTDDGRTLLIEINEGYSLGSGHLKANQYADLLRSRWEEMTGNG